MNSKKHANSFSSQPTHSTKAPKKVEPLSRTFFSQLIKIEMDFYNKQYTASTLDELIQYYAKAVEYYDTIKDEISSYFIFKIQDALATKKSLTLLMDHNSKINVKKSMGSISGSSPKMSSSDNLPPPGLKPASDEKAFENEIITEKVEEYSEGEEEDDEAVKEYAKKRKAYLEKKNKKLTAPSFTTMRNQKQRFVNFFHKMENEKAQRSQDLNTLLHSFGNSAIGNDQMVLKDLNKQKERLQLLLEERKQRSISALTLNASSGYNNLSGLNFGDNKDINGSKRFEDVLKDLEENEENITENLKSTSTNNHKVDATLKIELNGDEHKSDERNFTPSNKNLRIRIAERGDKGDGNLELSPIVHGSETDFEKKLGGDFEFIPSQNNDSHTMQGIGEKERIDEVSISPSNASLQNIQENNQK